MRNPVTVSLDHKETWDLRALTSWCLTWSVALHTHSGVGFLKILWPHYPGIPDPLRLSHLIYGLNLQRRGAMKERWSRGEEGSPSPSLYTHTHILSAQCSHVCSCEWGQCGSPVQRHMRGQSSVIFAVSQKGDVRGMWWGMKSEEEEREIK